jgi:hypothetical protein
MPCSATRPRGRGCSTPEQAQAAWARGEYAALVYSTCAKVAAIADLYERVGRGTFRLGGGSLQGSEVPTPCVIIEAEESSTTSANPAPSDPAARSEPFPMPANATWPQLKIRFVDGHTVLASIGGVAQALNYRQMGMMDRRNDRPNKQWELLRVFAREQGRLTWHSPGASRKNQKHKHKLARALKALFRIQGEPIVATEDGKGWQTAFGLLPDS